MGINYSPKIVTDNLVLCLDAANPLSYPGSGNTWYDLSGSNNHGTLGTTSLWNNSGKFMSFDGSNSSNIIVGSISQVQRDIIIGMYSEGSSGTGLEMVYSVNNSDYSFRTQNGSIRYIANNGNDFSYQYENDIRLNGQSISQNTDIVGRWIIIRLVSRNTNSFIYSISSNFLNRRYKGKIQFIHAYSNILSNDKINQNYLATKGRFGL
jgi:hypothetical protein